MAEVFRHPGHVTTDRTLLRDLQRSLKARGFDAGTTFGDFVEAVKRAGIRDNDPLGSIEYGVSQTPTGRIVVDHTDDGIEIREVR